MNYRQAADGEPLTAGQLANAAFRTSLSSDDPSPRHDIHGEWYCENEHCPVREVRVNAKWPEGDRPKMPRFACPSCGLNLKFHGHVKTTTLTPE